MAERERVVDADGHTMEPDDLWTSRMDQKRWGDWIPSKVVEDDTYNILWASDYPHPEFHPGVVKELREAIAGLDASTQQRILGENAVAAYKLSL